MGLQTAIVIKGIRVLVRARASSSRDHWWAYGSGRQERSENWFTASTTSNGMPSQISNT